ncbi:hypothetical protein [Sulfitobacter sabulilitoris]|uniref:Uncharacterized protein n=1 Tax=Sulfitobacter sabulilitoris TaxID=2562655 RepID=A0A5S3QCC1_9RHOB|nr:hypothetical protein [Sulfitobacter sabulilitoris]TMM54732.1 hypothetical protein FDT80_03900 [Sulfitobacter sabulilitoris]
MLIDTDYGLHASRPDGAQALYRAVIARTVLDLFGKVIPASEQDEAQFARREALYFLTREGGAWAESRRNLCDAAGLNADDLRSNILRVLAGREIVGADHRSTFGGIDAARALWAAEQSAPAKAQERRIKRQADKQIARPRRVKASYSTIRSAVLPLLSEPRQFRDLIHATDGEFGDGAIRKVLANAINKGEIVRNGENHTYVLAAA